MEEAMTELEMWSAAARAEGTCAALIKHGFDAVFVKTKEEAAAEAKPATA